MTSSLLLAAAAAVRLPVVPSRGAVAAPTRAAIRACAAANEFPRPYAAGGLKKSARVALEATDAECAALAKRFELEALGALAANVTLTVVDRQRQRVRAVGTLSAADVVRTAFDGARKTQQLDDVAFESRGEVFGGFRAILRAFGALDDSLQFGVFPRERGGGFLRLCLEVVHATLHLGPVLLRLAVERAGGGLDGCFGHGSFLSVVSGSNAARRRCWRAALKLALPTRTRTMKTLRTRRADLSTPPATS